MRRRGWLQRRGISVIELIAAITVVSALLAATTPLLLYGVRTFVFLPRALAADDVATEVMRQLIEGGFSTLPGQTAPVGGLRFASRAVPIGEDAIRPALWLTESSRVGFLTSDGQLVLIGWDAASGTIRRSFPPPATICSTVPGSLTEETIPYQVLGGVKVTTTAGQLFQYYDQLGTLLSPPTCPPNSTIRRVEVAFVAQTGSGLFEQGDAKESVLSSVAIRFP